MAGISTKLTTIRTADLTSFCQAYPIENFATQIITVNSPVKMSPLKAEQAILPKTMHLTNSPVILSTPQRVMLNNSPRTPQSVLPSLLEQSSPWSGKRAHDYSDPDYPESKRSRKGEKGGKGLRHFSMKVCEKVQKKGTTSYNEVADELVAEFSDPQRHLSPTDQQAYDQKNIRRRVYDALNVLMAMNIISKEKKEIKWLGLPTNSAQECQNLETEKQRRLERISLKTQQLYDLILQQIAYKNLVERNKTLETQHQTPQPNSTIQLPFIVINTSKQTVIDCRISNDKTEYLFNFDNTFEIHDDIEVLKRMGLSFNLDKGTCSPEDLDKARSMVPKSLEQYVIQMAQGGDLPPGIKLSTNSEKVLLGQIDLSLHSYDAADDEVASATAHASGLSRHSSMGSLSDVQSRPGTSTPSEDDFSESDSDSSSQGDLN